MPATLLIFPMKRVSFSSLLVALVFWLGGCASQTGPRDTPPPLILISMDGFRWDYMQLHPAETPHLRALARTGISAKGLIPVFPSNTFPNHYSIATGLYPSHHGIVNNTMFDPALGEYFRYNSPASPRDPRWWQGEPIWVTAVLQGKMSACYYWPGSEAPIKGTFATYWKPYNYRDVTYESRLDELVSWLKRPTAERPAVTLFYLEETNSVGHKAGPDSPQLAAAIKLLDDRIGTMVTRFKAEGIEANLVFVSDHGMANVDPARTIIIEDYIDEKKIQIDFEGSVAGLRPSDGDIPALMASIARLPATFKAYRAENLPAHLQIDPAATGRVSPVWILPETGWEALRRSTFARGEKTGFDKGDHGFDPASSDMRGLFIAHGPSFKSDGSVIPAIENVHVYNLLCAAAGLKPAPNDGDDRLVRAVIKK